MAVFRAKKVKMMTWADDLPVDVKNLCDANPDVQLRVLMANTQHELYYTLSFAIALSDYQQCKHE